MGDFIQVPGGGEGRFFHRGGRGRRGGGRWNGNRRAEVEDMEEDAEEVGSTRELVGGNETIIHFTTTLKYWGNHHPHPSILLLKVVATANSI